MKKARSTNGLKPFILRMKWSHSCMRCLVRAPGIGQVHGVRFVSGTDSNHVVIGAGIFQRGRYERVIQTHVLV